VFWAAETETLAADLLEQATGAGLDRINAAFDVAFDVTSPFVSDFLSARSNQLAGGVTQTTYDQIVAAMAEGVSAGEGIPEIAERVRHVFSVASSARATVIARTEVISAYNGGQVLAAAQLPEDVVAGQEWIATRDARTRESHLEADGQVVRIGAPFSVGGDSLAYPGDPGGRAGNTIQCRCTVAFLTPDEMPQDRSARPVDVRAARALLELVPAGSPFDEARFRRALEVVR
jgi:SPP1 gp7 family putative phage head morphogenesis protein